VVVLSREEIRRGEGSGHQGGGGGQSSASQSTLSSTFASWIRLKLMSKREREKEARESRSQSWAVCACGCSLLLVVACGSLWLVASFILPPKVLRAGGEFVAEIGNCFEGAAAEAEAEAEEASGLSLFSGRSAFLRAPASSIGNAPQTLSGAAFSSAPTCNCEPTEERTLRTENWELRETRIEN